MRKSRIWTPPDGYGLIEYCPMTEGGGTQVRDLSPSNHTGTRNSAVWANSRGMSFDGVNDWIQGNSQLALSGNATFTITLWAYWNAATWNTNYPSTAGNNSTDTTNQGLSTTWRDGRPALDFWNNRWRATNNLSVQTWYHAAFTKSAGPINSTSQIYINGDAVSGSLEGINTTPNITQSIWVIGRLSSSHWWNGYIKKIHIYNRVLTASEIKDIYTSERAA